MKKTTKKLVVIFGMGIAYYLWLRAGGIAIPCIFRSITGWKCPGCGITTMIWNILELDFISAYQANPFLFLTAPLLVAEIVYVIVLSYQKRRLPRWNEYLAGIYAIALVIFGIVRNISA